MKILLLHPLLNMMGGATRLVLELAKFICERGDYVEIWSDNVDLPSTYQVGRHLTVRDISTLPPETPSLLNKAYMYTLSPLSYMFLPSEVKEFDLINCHNFPSNFASLSRYCKKIPVIWHCNEPSIFLYPPRTPVHNQGRFVNRCLLHLYQSIGQPLRLIDKLAVERISKITVLSQLISERIKRVYGRDAHVIRIGVDIKKFNPTLNADKIRETHGIFDRPCILTVTNFNNRIDLVLNAVRILKKKIKDVMFLIVGTGDDSVLRMMIKDYGLEEHILISKNVPDEVLPLYYVACDAFVFPQPYWSWSIAAIEAMACGKPVIVPENCGVAEVIQSNYNGIKVDILNAEDLAACIVNLLRDESLRKRIGMTARRCVELNLDQNVFFEAYYRLMINEVKN